MRVQVEVQPDGQQAKARPALLSRTLLVSRHQLYLRLSCRGVLSNVYCLGSSYADFGADPASFFPDFAQMRRGFAAFADGVADSGTELARSRPGQSPSNAHVWRSYRQIRVGRAVWKASGRMDFGDQVRLRG